MISFCQLCKKIYALNLILGMIDGSNLVFFYPKLDHFKVFSYFLELYSALKHKLWF